MLFVDAKIAVTVTTSLCIFQHCLALQQPSFHAGSRTTCPVDSSPFLE